MTTDREMLEQARVAINDAASWDAMQILSGEISVHLATTDPEGWMSVDDRLPESGGYYETWDSRLAHRTKVEFDPTDIIDAIVKRQTVGVEQRRDAGTDDRDLIDVVG